MDKNYFHTSSLALASAIQLASASKLQSVEKSLDSRKAIFIFNVTPDLDKVVKLFWQRTLQLDAFSYFETTKFLKSRLYDSKEG